MTMPSSLANAFLAYILLVAGLVAAVLIRFLPARSRRWDRSSNWMADIQRHLGLLRRRCGKCLRDSRNRRARSANFCIHRGKAGGSSSQSARLKDRPPDLGTPRARIGGVLGSHQIVLA